ncbi:TrbI/VirB10 family protein (plasmid) [Rhizobium oryzihabitans]|uniref:TrbI/VirB10 family protein n=2 Tax=Rhizobium oryzihabitans TaxID=2267833 RepID=A0A7L5BS93_9HYPH|nr:type IV secretion system protein VirB10 [Rhizobium oryzihabitans]QIB41681.1 TrbI/VirB10 family protein [Rhizobium oryzihabitans]
MNGEHTAPVADKRAKKKQLLGSAAFVMVGLVAMAAVMSSENNKKVGPTNIVDEEFQSMNFRPPSFAMGSEKPEPAPTEPAIIELPVAEPVEEKPDTTTFQVPPPPPPPVAVVAEPPAELAEPEVPYVFPERFKSKLIAVDQARGGASGGFGEGGAASGSAVAGEDQNSKYLAAASAAGDRSAKATKIDRIDAVVPEGTLIPGILETAIVSDLPGQIRAVTSQDVYSFDGRRVLIPTGTRLIGEYQSSITRGQKRIFVVWTRLIRDDGIAVRLNSIGTDSLGRSGLTGLVDNKWRERFGSAIMLSIVGAGASYATGYGSSGATNGVTSDGQRGEELARQTIAQTFSDMANTALQENLRIPPTISVSQGERIFIFVRQDLDFSEFYDDPVTEAMKEISRERRIR